MTRIYDVPVNDLIKQLAEDLKEVDAIKPPEWASFVKTGQNRERPPVERDWWYVRTAAVLRKVKRLGPVGTEKLRNHFGGKKRRGYRRPVFVKSSGSVLRKALQQLETAGLVKQGEKGVHKGRIVTGAGDKILNNAALKVKK